MEWILIAVSLIADQVSKYWIQMNQPLELEIIPKFFYITYVKNDGAAWNMLAGKQGLLSLLAAVASGVMLYYLLNAKKRGTSKMIQVALALMISGAIGNLIDRLMLSYVRDFLHFYPFGHDFPVFNIADTALTIGVALLILDAILDEIRSRKKGNSDHE